MSKLASTVYRFLQPYPAVASGARSVYERGQDMLRGLLKKDLKTDRLLVGGENAIPGGKYARLTDNPMRCSTRIADSPHVDFLRRYEDIGDDVLQPETLKATRYYQNAAEALDMCGYYFGAQSVDQLPEVASKFIDKFRGELTPDETPGRSRETSPVVVRRIAHSSGHYEVVDGHHRLAVAIARGAHSHPAFVLRDPPVTTPMQDLLLDGLWTRGERILYQPVDLPETQDWHLVRLCSDRIKLIDAWLADQPGHEGASYLDVGCSYGWFVAEMQKRGLDAHGVERDMAGIRIGRAVYGLRPEQIFVSEISNFCEANTRTFDFVSCFSVLHHFVLGKSRLSAEQFIGQLDRMTGRALFFDTGQNHERWFRSELAEWDDTHIESWIKQHTSFTQVTKLGVDRDNRGRERGNYSRSLFVCTR